jgi:membrane-bound lytic murein transglycosylase B
MHRAIQITIVCLALAAPLRAQAREFEAWLEDLRAEARGQGISEATLDLALREIEPRADRASPRSSASTWASV